MSLGEENEVDYTILLTGANGQLGRELQGIFSHPNHPYPHLKIIPYTSLEWDITNPSSYPILENQVNPYKKYILINAAAYTAVDLAQTRPQKAYAINHLAVELLQQWCQKNNVTLIHISTDFVFDGKKSTPYNEEDTPNPIGEYGLSKFLGEKVLMENQIFPKIIIRTSWLYGTYGHNFVHTMLNLQKKQTEIKVVDDQIGTPTYSLDLAEFILNNIKHFTKLTKPTIYHFSNDGVASWYDFAQCIFSLTNLQTTVIPIPSKAYKTLAMRPHYSVLSKEKINQYCLHKGIHWVQSLKKCMSII